MNPAYVGVDVSDQLPPFSPVLHLLTRQSHFPQVHIYTVHPPPLQSLFLLLPSKSILISRISMCGARWLSGYSVRLTIGWSRVQIPLGNFGNFLCPTLPVSFGRGSKSLWSILSGVYDRGSKRSHTGGKCVTCHGIHRPILASENIYMKLIKNCMKLIFLKILSGLSSGHRSMVLGVGISGECSAPVMVSSRGTG